MNGTDPTNVSRFTVTEFRKPGTCPYCRDIAGDTKVVHVRSNYPQVRNELVCNVCHRQFFEWYMMSYDGTMYWKDNALAALAKVKEKENREEDEKEKR